MPVTLKSRFPQIAAELPIMADTLAREAAGKVEMMAKERVRVRSGDLRDAIHVERRKLGTYEVVAGDGGDVFYGHMVENGTTHSPPFPFLIPALEAERDPVQKVYASMLKAL